MINPVVAALTSKSEICNRNDANIQNTHKCFLDIQSYVDKGIGHFFIKENNLDDVKYSSTKKFIVSLMQELFLHL